MADNVNIAALNMSQGILNLNGFTVTCSGNASFTGDSLLNGEILANNFTHLANMHLGGKIVFEKTGPGNANWEGNNRMHGDSLIVIWRWGTLHLENSAASPDSIFSYLKIQLADTYTVSFTESSPLYIQKDLILDNTGNGTFAWNSISQNTIIGGNLIGLNFSTATPNLLLRNITVNGTNNNSSFYCHTGSVNNCNINGNLTLVADSSVTFNISNSSFSGSNNLFQAGSFDMQNNRFGQSGTGTTVIRAANNLAGNVFMRDGNNKFLGSVQLETYADYPSGVTIQQTFYGADSCWGNMSYVLKGNASLITNGGGDSYVAGDLIIDGQGARKWVQFTGGAGTTFTVGGNLVVKDFTPYSEPGVGGTNVHLRNLMVAGTDTIGTFYCYTGDITNCSFNGDFKLVADSSIGFTISGSSFLGVNNLFQGGNLEVQNCTFGKTGSGTTMLKAAHNVGANVYMRDGNNKFFNNVRWETYALYPGGLTIQQTFYGADSCWGNMSYVLKGNAALTTNGNGHSYVAGNVVIDGQGARKWVQFAGGGSTSFTVDGNLSVKNFTPYSEPGTGVTNVYLRNLYVAGTDTIGTFYCYTGDINNCSFNGNMTLIADSSQGYNINNSLLLGADNVFQAGNLDIQNSKLGRSGNSLTVLKIAHNVAGVFYVRDGNNKFLGNVLWDATAPATGSILIQQTFHGPDTCLQNLTLNITGVTSANLGGNNLYIGKNLLLQNNGSGTIVHENGSSAIYFTGTDTASYHYNGAGTVHSLQNVGVNRQGGLRLLSPLTCSGLILARGIILSSPANPLQMSNSAVIVGGSDSSYVDGPMIKLGNSTFAFPLGRNNVYAPLSISAPSLTTDAFTAQYINHLAHVDGYDSTQLDASLNHLSRREYWILNRTAGTSSVKVTLSWKTSRSGQVNELADLRVAHWNGITWKDEGNGNTTGTNIEGAIQSGNTISSFSPFTLASISVNNPLPVKFISFTAFLNTNQTVLLQWKTAEELNNDHFEVERTNDGINWTILAIIYPQLSNEYRFSDNFPPKGINYYRIKQLDLDKDFFYTSIKTVRISNNPELFIWPNPAKDELHVYFPYDKATIQVADMSGKILLTTLANSDISNLSISQLKPGIYILYIKYANGLNSVKFMKQ